SDRQIFRQVLSVELALVFRSFRSWVVRVISIIPNCLTFPNILQ
ncbi:Transposase-like protein, IS200/IS605 family, partial [Crocosphaera watsonii WH 0003]